MKKNVLITGTSGGFGKLTALTLLKNGFNVAATMRNAITKNKEVAEELTSAGAKVIELDVTSDDSVTDGIKNAFEQLGEIDVVVNNAGVGVAGMQEHFTIDDFKKLFDVNLFGVQRINKAVLPNMRKKGEGLIIYVSSLLGRFTLPFYGPYNASKWALEALAENYRMELSQFGIENAIVEPGGYPTSFFNSLITPSDLSQVESYGEFMKVPQQMGEAFGKALEANPDQNPQDVADKILSIISSPKGERNFRNPVDKMGMGTPFGEYNNHLEEIMKTTLSNFGLSAMLK